MAPIAFASTSSATNSLVSSSWSVAIAAASGRSRKWSVTRCPFVWCVEAGRPDHARRHLPRPQEASAGRDRSARGGGLALLGVGPGLGDGREPIASAPGGGTVLGGEPRGLLGALREDAPRRLLLNRVHEVGGAEEGVVEEHLDPVELVAGIADLNVFPDRKSVV